jgi:uncharacterized membrane protein
MKARHLFITTAITSLLAVGISPASSAPGDDDEKCYGVTKAGQNGCNSNKSKHSCAGHSKIDNDPNDFIMLPQGSCLKIGGKLNPAGNKKSSPKKR